MEISRFISVVSSSASSSLGTMPAITSNPLAVINNAKVTTSNAPFWPAFSPLNSILYADPLPTTSSGIVDTDASVAVFGFSDSVEVITKSITVVPLMVPDASSSVSRSKRRSW